VASPSLEKLPCCLLIARQTRAGSVFAADEVPRRMISVPAGHPGTYWSFGGVVPADKT
jgi:hypothetical protein